MHKNLALCIATCIWLPCIHFFFSAQTTTYRQPDKIAPKAGMLAEQHLQMWRDPSLRAQKLEEMHEVTQACWQTTKY